MKTILVIIAVAIFAAIAIVFSFLAAVTFLLFVFAFWLNSCLVEICRDVRSKQ